MKRGGFRVGGLLTTPSSIWVVLFRSQYRNRFPAWYIELLEQTIPCILIGIDSRPSIWAVLSPSQRNSDDLA